MKGRYIDTLRALAQLVFSRGHEGRNVLGVLTAEAFGFFSVGDAQVVALLLSVVLCFLSLSIGKDLEATCIR